MADGLTPELKQGLVTIGYLAATDVQNGEKVRRAIRRFQRHAARTYRMPQPDASSGDLFRGQETGVCDDLTSAEIKKWLDRKWKVPIGRIQLQGINSAGSKPAYMRQDVAVEWLSIVRLVAAKGGVLDGNYGDSARPVRPTGKVGSSRYSFHYAARAVDIC